MFGRSRKTDGAPSPGLSQVMFKPGSVREVKKYLRPPLAEVSAVLYFTESEQKPFLLHGSGGLTADGRFRLGKNWKLTKDKLDRIFIVTHLNGQAVESDDAEELP